VTPQSSPNGPSIDLAVQRGGCSPHEPPFPKFRNSYQLDIFIDQSLHQASEIIHLDSKRFQYPNKTDDISAVTSFAPKQTSSSKLFDSTPRSHGTDQLYVAFHTAAFFIQFRPRRSYYEYDHQSSLHHCPIL
jgi:hypothetical protein